MDDLKSNIKIDEKVVLEHLMRAGMDIPQLSSCGGDDLKNKKSKTVKRPKKLIIEEKSKIKLYRPRNVISEFKQLRTLNNSINNTLYSKKN